MQSIRTHRQISPPPPPASMAIWRSYQFGKLRIDSRERAGNTGPRYLRVPLFFFLSSVLRERLTGDFTRQPCLGQFSLRFMNDRTEKLVGHETRTLFFPFQVGAFFLFFFLFIECRMLTGLCARDPPRRKHLWLAGAFILLFFCFLAN